MKFLDELNKKYGELEYFVNGGISMLFNIKNNDDIIIKVIIFPSIYNNNVKYYKMLDNKLNIVKMNNNFIFTFNYNNIDNMSVKTFINNKEQYVKKLYKVDTLNNLEMKFYCIEMNKYQTNSYYFFYSLFNNKTHNGKEHGILFSYYIYYSLLMILSLYNMNISHNDFKMDNILVKLNNNKDKIDYFNNKNYSLINNFKYNFYLNDFDLTLNTNNNTADLDSFKKSVFTFFEEKKKLIDIKNYDYILSKLKNTNTIDDIEKLWITNSSSYRQLNIFQNIIKDYIDNK